MSDTIRGWHAHVYFDATTLETARAVCEAAERELPVQKGRLHAQPVGPHPQGSCQLAFAPQALGPVIAWLTLHRRGLTVFAHPETGDELTDHRDRAVWIGQSQALDLAALARPR